jgi:hypothetical protein
MNEATFETRLYSELRKIFPDELFTDIAHQDTFSIHLGHKKAQVNGKAKDSMNGRSDILIKIKDTPFAIFELKAPDIKITDDDIKQGLSYARHIDLSLIPPLVIVTNGTDIKYIDTYSKEEFDFSTESNGEKIKQLFDNALKRASATREEMLNLAFSQVDVSLIHPDVKDIFKTASHSLLNWQTTLENQQWLERSELETIYQKIINNDSSETLLLGEPGCGKSALLARLGKKLAAENITLLAIKADFLSETVVNQKGLAEYLELPNLVEICVKTLAQTEKIVVLIDQLDALCDLVIQHPERLNVLLNLITAIAKRNNVHLVASCRTFEYEYDIRLSNLEIKATELVLPTWHDIKPIFQQKAIDTTYWNKDLCEFLRVPQHLKIFETLYQNSNTEYDLSISYHSLLDKLWEYKCISEQEEALLENITIQMTKREMLWLPIHLYKKQSKLLKILKSKGILTEQSKKIGFPHQTLFEYVRARTFLGNNILSDYIVERQDSLFVRSQLWHSLQYLRETDDFIYGQELDILWNQPLLRKHIKQLLIEFLGQVSVPTDNEAVKLLPYLSDSTYRVKTLDAIKNNPAWFERISQSYLPRLMQQPEVFNWTLIVFLQNAWEFDRETVLKLLKKYWYGNEDKHSYLWNTLIDIKSWDDESVNIMCQLIKLEFDVRNICKLVENIFDSSPNLSIKPLQIFLNLQLLEAKKQNSYEAYTRLLKIKVYYELFQIIPVIPKLFLDNLWEWFLDVLEYMPNIGNVEHICMYSKKGSLSSNEYEHNVINLFEIAIISLAEKQPIEFLNFVEKYGKLDIGQIQCYFGQGMLKLAEIHPSEVLGFLLSDPRRFELAPFLGDEKIITRQLLKAVFPYLTRKEKIKLEQAIIDWKRYISDIGETAQNKRDLIRYNREHRLRLLKTLSSQHVTESTKKFIEEEERAFPILPEYITGIREMTYVESYISVEQMQKASNNDLLNLFEQLIDNTEPNFKRLEKGGSEETSREFTKLAEQNPQKAINIIEQLDINKNEMFVARGLSGIAKTEYSTKALFELIIEFDKRGCQSDEFRCHVADIVRDKAKERAYVPDDILILLESWIYPYKPSENQVFDTQKDKSDKGFHSIIPHHPYIGDIFPHGGNYPILSALSTVYILQEPRNLDKFISLLENHIDTPENNKVWESFTEVYLNQFLVYEIFKPYYSRIEIFLDKLFTSYPTVFFDTIGVICLLKTRFRLSKQFTKKWLKILRDDSQWYLHSQAYAEALVYFYLNFPHDSFFSSEINRICKLDSSKSKQNKNLRIGLAFTVSFLWWRPENEEYRVKLIKILLQLIPDVDKDIQKAISSGFYYFDSLIMDEYAIQILEALCSNPLTLESLNEVLALRSLVSYTQSHPEIIYKVCSVYLEQIEKITKNQRYMLSSSSIIHIAQALQRLPEFQAQGLDIYERLLDLDTYEAEKALRKIDKRFLNK